jgi:hypothetical protein
MPATRPREDGRENGGDLQIINARVANNSPTHNMTGLLAALSARGTAVRINPKPSLLSVHHFIFPVGLLIILHYVGADDL